MGCSRPSATPTPAATVHRAWDLGIRYFDTAPLYGYGAAERRIGAALASAPREEFAISTKVGRLIRPTDAIADDADIDRQELDGRENAFYVGTGPVRPVFDYSVRRRHAVGRGEPRTARPGARSTSRSSTTRTTTGRPRSAGAYPALERLRANGVVGAIGAGMNQSAMLARFAREGDFDVFLLAGRYTLLDQSALADLLPICEEKEIGVVIGGVMNSGILADPRPGGRFNYAPAAADVVARAEQLAAICARHGVPLKAAAVQFPLAHPAVVSVVAGVRRIDHLEEYPELMRRPIPADLWAELRREGLLADGAATP